MQIVREQVGLGQLQTMAAEHFGDSTINVHPGQGNRSRFMEDPEVQKQIAEIVDRLAAALDRCLELFDLTLADERWHGRRREIARARELVCDFLVGDNAYGSTRESLDAYFLPFALAARRLKVRS